MNHPLASPPPPSQPSTPRLLPATQADWLDDLLAAGVAKARRDTKALLVRAAMAGALLGLATCLSYLAMVGQPPTQARLLAGVVFPVGFMVIMLLKLELIAGNFTLLSFANMKGRISRRLLLRNWGWVYVGNFIGSLIAGLLLAVVLTDAFLSDGGVLAGQLVTMAESKTLAYQQAGWHGWCSVFIKAILCNWLVALAVVLGIIIPSVPGKIIAAWLPLMNFMALGFEHAVVNLFVVPSGMLLGADIGIPQWLVWNFLPVTLGNLLGGVMVSLCLYYGWQALPTKKAS